MSGPGRWFSIRTAARREPEKYWTNVGKEQYSRYLKPAMKADSEIKEAAATATSGAKTDEEKALALIQYIRKNLRDLFGSQVTEADRAQILKQMPKDRYRNAKEIFKSGIGDADELNTLFAAMANSAGLEVRPALTADREDIVFVPAMVDSYFLRHIDMGVNIGGNWKLYDVERARTSGQYAFVERGRDAGAAERSQETVLHQGAGGGSGSFRSHAESEVDIGGRRLY